MKSVEAEIIKHLIKNPRESYAKISKELGLSAESVRQKVLKMINQGDLKLYCVPNGRYLGKRRITMILKLPMAEKATIIKTLRELPHTTEIRSGVLSNTVVMDIITEDVDRDTHNVMKLFKELGIEVKEFFESEWVHFDPWKMMD